MTHTLRDKTRFLNRIRRIRGQVESIERGLVQEQESTAILQTLAACRGAINGLMAEVMEGHVRHHVLDPRRSPTEAQSEAADDLVAVIRAYLK